MATKTSNFVKQIPNTVNLNQVAEQVENSTINHAFINAFKKFSNLKGSVLIQRFIATLSKSCIIIYLL